MALINHTDQPSHNLHRLNFTFELTDTPPAHLAGIPAIQAFNEHNGNEVRVKAYVVALIMTISRLVSPTMVYLEALLSLLHRLLSSL